MLQTTDKHDQNDLVDDPNIHIRELNSSRSKATLNFARRSSLIHLFDPIIELENTQSYVGKNEDSMYLDTIGPSLESLGPDWNDWIDAGLNIHWYDDPLYPGFHVDRRETHDVKNDGIDSIDIPRRFRMRFPGFQSAKSMMKAVERQAMMESENVHRNLPLGDNENNDICNESHSTPSPDQNVNHEREESTSEDESGMMLNKTAQQVTDQFEFPSQGELHHPYIGWRIDKVAMEEYMRNYAKQEGFAVYKSTNGKVIYWRCVHAGKYRNRRGLPADVTDRSKRQEHLDAGNALPSERLN